MNLPPAPQQSYRATRTELAGFLLASLDLLASRWDALEQQVDPRSRAVGLTRLKDCGATESLLLWMLYHDFVAHVRPAPEPPRADGVQEARGDSLVFGETSAFALTARGETFVDAFLARVLSTPEDFQTAWDGLVLGRLIPCYHREERVLTWGRRVLKAYRQPSANQELILCTAEELRWPAWFDDPLLHKSPKKSKIRLHDTIKFLNRNQTPHLLHFKGDGTGTRVGWEYR